MDSTRNRDVNLTRIEPPTKAALCQEIIENTRRADPQLVRLAMRPPSTDTLILMTFALVRHLVLGRLGKPELVIVRQRLVLQSMIEDGEYARADFTEIEHQFLPAFNASLRAAEQAGDVRPGGPAPANGLWFGALVTALIAYGRLSCGEALPTLGELDARVTEAARFILRGIGLRDELVAAPFDLRRLALFTDCGGDAGTSSVAVAEPTQDRCPGMRITATRRR